MRGVFIFYYFSYDISGACTKLAPSYFGILFCSFDQKPQRTAHKSAINFCMEKCSRTACPLLGGLQRSFSNRSQGLWPIIPEASVRSRVAHNPRLMETIRSGHVIVQTENRSHTYSGCNSLLIIYTLQSSTLHRM